MSTYRNRPRPAIGKPGRGLIGAMAGETLRDLRPRIGRLLRTRDDPKSHICGDRTCRREDEGLRLRVARNTLRGTSTTTPVTEGIVIRTLGAFPYEPDGSTVVSHGELLSAVY